MSNPVNWTVRDFQLCSKWSEEVDGERFYDGSAKYVTDQSTGRKYLNESDTLTRFKFVIFATVGTPIFHSVSSVGHIAYRLSKLISASHFWVSKENEAEYSFVGRLEDAGTDLLKVVTAPIVLVCLELTSIYGVFNVRDGRKVFSSLERFAFEKKFFLSPCFQPNPTHHLLGGDINERNTT